MVVKITVYPVHHAAHRSIFSQTKWRCIQELLSSTTTKFVTLDYLSLSCGLFSPSQNLLHKVQKPTCTRCSFTDNHHLWSHIWKMWSILLQGTAPLLIPWQYFVCCAPNSSQTIPTIHFVTLNYDWYPWDGEIKTYSWNKWAEREFVTVPCWQTVSFLYWQRLLTYGNVKLTWRRWKITYDNSRCGAVPFHFPNL